MIRSFLKRIGVGRFYYRRIHPAKERLRWRLYFGWKLVLPMAASEHRMMARARSFAPLSVADPSLPALSCSYMTGHRFWHQTVLCARSLARFWPGPFHPTFYDDGSLLPAESVLLLRLFPTGTILTTAAIQARLEESLPASRYPILRALRRKVIMMRKLVDVRASSRGWQLYLDSDMLFFRRPDMLLEWSERRAHPFCMQDTVDGYCAPLERVNAAVGRSVAPFVNAGVLGFDDRQIDWDRVEHWCSQFSDEERHHILFEQTLSAALLTAAGHKFLPMDDYRVLYDFSASPPPAALLHYVHRAKPMYFMHEWKRCFTARDARP